MTRDRAVELIRSCRNRVYQAPDGWQEAANVAIDALEGRPGKCGCQRRENGYMTDCGHEVRHVGREWKHCPFCGGVIIKVRRDWL